MKFICIDAGHRGLPARLFSLIQSLIINDVVFAIELIRINISGSQGLLANHGIRQLPHEKENKRGAGAHSGACQSMQESMELNNPTCRPGICYNLQVIAVPPAPYRILINPLACMSQFAFDSEFVSERLGVFMYAEIRCTHILIFCYGE